MKRLLMSLFCAVAVGAVAFAGDEEVTVKVSVAGVNNSALMKECVVAGKKAAVKKYLSEMGNDKITDKVVTDAAASYAKFIDGEPDADESNYNGTELTCSFTVTLKPEEIAKWLEGKGIDLNAGADGAAIEIFVKEEPQDAGQMQLGDAMGNFFFTRYNKFQRTIRDMLADDARKFGFKVVLLEDNENYEEFKAKDPVLVGVSYDVNGDTKGFTTTPGFLRKVQENNPDAIVMYYRIDGLTYNPQTKKIRVSAALNLKNLADNSTEPVGSVEGIEIGASGSQQDEIMIDFGKAVSGAMEEILTTKGAGKKIAASVKAMRNAAKRPKGPMKLVINCSAVDSKIKIKVRNGLKKSLVSSGLTKQTKVVKDSLSCVVTPSADFGDLDDVWGKVSEILPEFLGDEIEFTDDWAKKNGDTLTVTIGK